MEEEQDLAAMFMILSEIRQDVKTLLERPASRESSGKPKEPPKCRDCGAEVKWVKTPKGKNMMIDVQPIQFAKQGEFIWTADGDCRKVTEATFNPQSTGRDWHSSHFGTCPNKQHGN